MSRKPQVWRKALRPYITMLETVFYIFVAGGERIAMAMVVVGHLYTKYHGYTQHYLLDPLPEAICVAMATCNFVGKMLLTSIISNEYN